MRSTIIIAMALLGACSEGADTGKKQAAAPATRFDAGLWETTIETTAMRPADEGTPRIKTEVGQKTTSSVCVPEADRLKPPPALFVGGAGKCEYKDSYMRNGRLSASIRCTRPGLSGDVMTNVSGTFQAASFEATTNTATYLTTDGDVAIDAKVTGRRTGDCPAEEGKAAK
jgi:hypothetical protein